MKSLVVQSLFIQEATVDGPPLPPRPYPKPSISVHELHSAYKLTVYSSPNLRLDLKSHI